MTDTGETCHYLEAAPNDVPSEMGIYWITGTVTDISGTETIIGSGRKNTALILASSDDPKRDFPAAFECNTYGYPNDWFLPSIDELKEFCLSNHGNISSAYYWSSSQVENDPSSVWIFDYDNKESMEFPKLMTGVFVRPIRAF